MTTIVQDYLDMAKTEGHIFQAEGIAAISEMVFPGVHELNPFADMIEASWRTAVIADKNFTSTYLCFGMFYMFKGSSRDYAYREFDEEMKKVLGEFTFFPAKFAEINGEVTRSISSRLGEFYGYIHTEATDEYDDESLDRMEGEFIWGLIRAIWIQKIVNHIG